jgi:hypothetical protein
MVLGAMLLAGVVLAKTCGATCYGDSGKNTLIGTNGRNTIHAKGGGDDVKGLQGKDSLYGGGGGDALAGGAGFDILEGGNGYDWLNGNRGNDRLRGMEDPAPYSTARQKHRKVEVLIGDYGNDTIRARDGKKDIVRGGPGYDKAYVDGVDKVTGVEVERCGGGGCTKPPGSGVTTPPGDKPPEAVYDNPTVEERNCASDPPRPLDVVNNDTDDDGGPMTIQSVTQPDNGEVTITNNGNDLTYKPVVGYYNDDTDGTVDPPDDFTYTLNGGSTAQVDVIVELAGGVC